MELQRILLSCFMICFLFISYRGTTGMSTVFFDSSTTPIAPASNAGNSLEVTTPGTSFMSSTSSPTTAATPTTSVDAIETNIFTITDSSSKTTTVTTTTQTVEVLKRGLKCNDKNDQTFVRPDYCSLSLNQLVVTRDIDGKGFDFIVPGAFDGLDIKLLNLSGLSLKSIDATSFQGLSNLNTLYLDHNDIKDLPEDTFSNLPQLSYVYLHSNQLTKIKTGLLTNQKNLKEVTLRNNFISVIENNSFENQEVLEKLHLDGNLLPSVNKEMFKGLLRLQELNLGDNRIVTLSTDLFEYLGFLQILNLTRNSIQFIPDNIFANLFNFVTLDLSFNDIQDFGDKAFEDKRYLSEIYLNNNQLKEIKKITFAGLDGMSSIYFHNNHISDLRSESLSGLTQLKNLVLRNNSIHYLPIGWLDALGNLESVDLSHNVIDIVDSGPFRTPIRLKQLDLSFNRLHSLGSEWFSTNGDLKELKLRANLLTNLPDGIFTVPKKIESLDLGSNRLKQEVLKNMFLNLTSLKVLRLDNNSMTMFDADDARCQALLEELYLNASCLEGVRVAGFDNLKRLDLQRNNLQSLSTNDISGLISLQSLDASDNNITQFDFKSLEKYQNLKLVNLSLNLLTDSSSLIPTSSNQITFDFSWNSFGDLSTFPNLNRFYIASEQLQCQCNQLPQWNSLDSFVDYKQTVCTDGKDLHFLACYLTNPSTCQTKPGLNTTALVDWCSKATPSMAMTTRPIIYKESCKFPKPEIFDFKLTNFTDGFEVTWNATNINSLKWFTITWTQEFQNSSYNSTDESPPILSRNTEFSTRLLKSGMTTVCVATEPVYMFIPKSEQCGQFNFTAATTNPSSAIGSIPFWVWIIVALGILILLLIIIITVAVCIRKSKNKRFEKERLEEERRKNEMRRAPSFGFSPPDPNLPQDTAEQAVISLDMYHDGSN